MIQNDLPTKRIRTIFMGTPEFAIAGLRELLNSPEFEIVGVFTQTDKPSGRKQIMTSPIVKQVAQEKGIKIFQPLKIKTEVQTIKELNPDLVVVIAYGQIITPEILDLPTYGFINVHASLLPKYRGAACLNAPILNGDKETGVTIMKMDSGLDTGPILRQAKIQLAGTETLEDIHDKLSALGAKILIPTLLDYIAGEIKPQKQDDNQSSYIKTLKKEDGQIDWSKPAQEIERMIRAYNPWPGTYGLLNSEPLKSDGNKIIKILQTENQILPLNNHKTGEIFLHEKKLAIQCGQDSLVILKLQLEGKKPLNANDFLAGNRHLIGSILS